MEMGIGECLRMNECKNKIIKECPLKENKCKRSGIRPLNLLIIQSETVYKKSIGFIKPAKHKGIARQA
jgi:hypothetical protein